MALNLYNTLTKKIELFTSLDGENVGMYSCGPTVYNYAHIGNFRAYLSADIVKRALGYCGYEVKHIMNLTDVDDKTIRDSQSAGKTLEALTTFYAEEFKKDSLALHILAPNRYTRAVEHIPEMVALIEQLIAKGFAYATEDGSVYFNIKNDSEYGQLSTIVKNEQLQNAAGRIKKDEYEKDNASDFALWKAWDESDSDVFWETSLGKGRPGWHIECSAMSMQYLGNSFDIHTGGVDLIFPHHENEIAQSECATGEKFVRYWIHNEWVMVEGKKMAKSAGNFTTLETIRERGFDPIAFRLLTLMSHYRSPLNFTWEALEGASSSLSRLKNFFSQAFQAPSEEVHVDAAYKTRFMASIENDLNTGAGLAILHELMRDKEIPLRIKAETALDFDRVLGLGLCDPLQTQTVEIPEHIQLLAEQRENARIAKDWALSDTLRAQIEREGYSIKDTQNGPFLRKE